MKYLPQTKLPDLIPPSVINKLMNEVYLYWSHKRNHGNSAKINSSQGKALCRKYWIPTPASDTNPHHTFRPRDKERYRLRRQQKKNDLESFQKLQQVRREFAQARILSQLIVEREKLTESSLEIQHRIFEQTLIDNKLGYLLEEPGSDGVSKKKSTGAFKHTLTYEHLLRPLTTTATQEQLQQLVGSFTDKNRNANRNANTLRKMGIMSKKSSGSSASAASKDDNVEEADSETGPSDKMKTLKKLGLVSGLKRKRGSTDASGASSGAANRNSEKINQIELIQNNQQIMSHYEALLGSLLQASNNPSAANPAALLSSAQGSSSASVFNTLLEQIYVSNPEHFNKLSPLYQTVLYRTFYPDFMEESSVRPNSIEEVGR